ncbi:MAG: sensor histidine kinase [Candidatus Planktophila sp.]
MSAHERVKLAQELHDGIAQDLVGLSYFIDSLVAQINTPDQLRGDLRQLRFNITELIERVRREIFQLRAAPMQIDLTQKGDQQYELSRVFNELIRNIYEHSQASEIELMIADNGIGGAHMKDGHDGLRGVTERIKDLDGTISIDSTETGTRISMKIPRSDT